MVQNDVQSYINNQCGESRHCCPGKVLGQELQWLKFIIHNILTPARRHHRSLISVNQFRKGIDGRLANEMLRAKEFYDVDVLLYIIHCLWFASGRAEQINISRPPRNDQQRGQSGYRLLLYCSSWIPLLKYGHFRQSS